MSAQSAARVPHPADIPDATAATAASKAWRSAPLEEQIAELRRLQDGQRKYHAKVMAIGTNAKPTLYRLSDWRLASAIRTLEAMLDQPGTGAA